MGEHVPAVVSVHMVTHVVCYCLNSAFLNVEYATGVVSTH